MKNKIKKYTGLCDALSYFREKGMLDSQKIEVTN